MLVYYLDVFALEITTTVAFRIYLYDACWRLYASDTDMRHMTSAGCEETR